MNFQDNHLLTPVLKISTTAPFPELSHDKDNTDEALKTVPSSTSKVSLRVCSEFLEHHAPVDEFYSLNRIVYLLDNHGQPLTLSIDTQGHLVLLAHVDHGPQAWQQFTISPGAGNETVTAFGAIRSPGKIHIAAAVLGPGDTSRLFHMTVPVPLFTFNRSTGKVEPDIAASINWIETPYNLGRRKIESVHVGRTKAPVSKDSKFAIGVGTAVKGSLDAAFYYVDPSTENTSPWTLFPLPVNSKALVDIEAAITAAGTGFFLLHKTDDQTGIVQLSMAEDGSWQQSVGLLTKGEIYLGNVKDISACTTVSSQTDLYAASEHGIGYFQALDVVAPPRVILPEISFNQVVATEELDVDYPKVQQSHISLVALSVDGDLFFIQGTRSLAHNTVEFVHSGLPIRTNVRTMSCLYNKTLHSHEIIYASNTESLVEHMALDPESGHWNGSKVCLHREEEKPLPVPAYMTTITCVNEHGSSVGEGHAVELSGENVLLSVNKRALSLGVVPKTVHTDRSGKITIVTTTDSALAAPEIKIRLSHFNDKGVHEIYPSQRVVRLLAGVKSADDITNAVSTTGKVLFEHLKTDSKLQAAVQGAADVLKEVPGMITNLSTDAADKLVGGATEAVKDLVKIWEKDEHGTRQSADDSWIDKAKHILHQVGDTIEWLKSKFKGIVKGLVRFAVRVIGKAIDFVIEIGGKIVRFVVQKVGGLVRALANFLQEFLGLDMSGFLDWLGLLFDVDEIKKTQTKMNEFGWALRKHLHTFNTKNEAFVEHSFDNISERIKKNVGRNPPKRSEPVQNDALELFSWLLENPIMEKIKAWNPFLWLLDAERDGLMEGISDLIQTPDFSILWDCASGVISDVLQTTIVSLWSIVSDLWEKVQTVAKNPEAACDTALGFVKDSLLTMLDELKHIVGGMMKIVTAIVEQTFEVLQGKWKIPLVTTLFETYADQDFSLMNVVTFSLAQLMHIFFQVTLKKKPFEVLGDIMDLFTGWTDETLDVGSLDWTSTDLKSTVPVSGITIMAMASPTEVRIAAADSPHGRFDMDGNDALPAGWPRNQEDTDYLASKRRYALIDAALGGFSVLGTVLSGAIGVAAYTSMSKNELPPKPEHHETVKIQQRELAKEKQLTQATVTMKSIGCTLALIGRSAQFINFVVAVKGKDRLASDLKDLALLDGYGFPVIMNCVAALLDVVNCFAFTSVGMTVTTNVMLKIGDIMQQVCLREIYEPVGDAAIRNPWSKRKVPGGLRIFSDGTGMVCDVASYWKETEPGAIVMGISGGVSMASLGLALAIENHSALNATREMSALHLLQ